MEVFNSNNKLINYRFLMAIVFILLPLTASGVDFSTMLNALQMNSVPIIRLTKAIAFVLGFWFMISAVQELKMIGHAQHGMSSPQGGLGKPLTRFILGVALLYFPTTIDTAVATLWGSGGIMGYDTVSVGEFDQVKAGIFALVQAVGYISFVRGFVILSRSTQQGAQQGSLGKGVVHIVGGIMAINIAATIEVIKNSLGFVV